MIRKKKANYWKTKTINEQSSQSLNIKLC
jgi:hypothetical protein